MSYVNPTISSANQVLTLTVAGLFPSPVTIQGFSVDSYYESEAVDIAEVQMGVDGRLSGGVVRNPVPLTIELQADSPSRGFFAAIYDAMDLKGDMYWMNGTITHPATGETYALTRGILVSRPKFASAGKTLKPMTHKIVFERSARSVL